MNTLQYAINMEHDGEKYYRGQAEINKNNELQVVCNLLADEEKIHGEILESKKNKLAYKLIDLDLLSNAKNMFTSAPDIDAQEKRDSSQLAFYRIAADMEKKSIELYQQFLADATDADEKELCKYLIKQEKQHYELFDEMGRLLTNAENWIESPEFGRREEEF
ncbi:MAG TPA: ferritin family protein [Clostridiaceae bacterium]